VKTMPLQGAPLAEYCGGPASLCAAVNLDCNKCQSIHKEQAEERRRQGKKMAEVLRESQK
jgi:hypothetical protein